MATAAVLRIEQMKQVLLLGTHHYNAEVNDQPDKVFKEQHGVTRG